MVNVHTVAHGEAADLINKARQIIQSANLYDLSVDSYKGWPTLWSKNEDHVATFKALALLVNITLTQRDVPGDMQVFYID